MNCQEFAKCDVFAQGGRTHLGIPKRTCGRFDENLKSVLMF